MLGILRGLRELRSKLIGVDRKSNEIVTWIVLPLWGKESFSWFMCYRPVAPKGQMTLSLTVSHSHVLTFSRSHIFTFSHSHVLTLSRSKKIP